MSTENAMPLDEPLDVNLDDVDINFPVFPAGLYRARVKGFIQKPNKDANKNPNVFCQFVNLDPITTTAGAAKAPGEFTFNWYLASNPSDKNPDWDWQKARKENLARLKKAVTGDAKGQFVLADIVDRNVKLKLSIDPTGNNGEPSNNIDTVLPDTTAVAGVTGAQGGSVA